jgi:hypothetical protein
MIWSPQPSSIVILEKMNDPAASGGELTLVRLWRIKSAASKK